MQRKGSKEKKKEQKMNVVERAIQREKRNEKLKTGRREWRML